MKAALCQTCPHLGELLGCVGGVAFQELAIKLDLKMQDQPQTHFLFQGKEGIFLSQGICTAVQGSFWYRHLDPGSLCFFCLNPTVSVFCTE